MLLEKHLLVQALRNNHNMNKAVPKGAAFFL